MSVTATNPILPGFYPDPSICAVGDDFYLVNSSFAYFPGIPIMHSKDLAHWEQIGNACDRESQLPLGDTGHSRGLFAPTIRYHEGTFYIICTNVSYGGNFIITAQNPTGPWSEPHYIEGADGIDPSLFFDEDGTCYYIGTHPNPAGCQYDGDWYIWIQELDIENMKLVGEVHNVWNGAMRNIIWPEGPHLYKIGEYYYIMHAEGGTGPDHAVTVCRSKNVYGPYENNFCNPILTHRHLGRKYPICYVGHADLVKTINDEWYMVMLAVRPLEGYTTMGRETFLARVEWENDWPVVNPGVGRLTDTVEINLPKWTAYTAESNEYVFSTMGQLPPEFMVLRNADKSHYSLEKGKGLLMLFDTHTLKEQASPSYLALRQKHHHFMAKALLDVSNLSEDKRAGIAYVQNNLYNLRVEVNGKMAEVILCEKGTDRRVISMPLQGSNPLEVSLEVDGLSAAVIIEGQKSPEVDIRTLSTEAAGGFTGCTVGLYAVADTENTDCACFKRFSYSEAL
ncbi:MAG: glycoside hydrolase 43 family protein [Lachnospiraceae bacterium]|nr:MAG: glycoside hydrolase 43 family protein [Lachnospiraceae bacterium]